MATADEILATMSAEEEKAYLVIESDLRTIRIPDEVKILGVESDDDVLRLHFKMPKMYGEFDLSEFELRVNYMNAGNEPDLYEVKDAAVNGDVIEFSWLVGRTAAKFKGDVKFIVCAKKMDADGVVEKEFNTTTAKLPVLEGLETSEAVVQLHPDIIEAILLRLNKLETSGGITAEQIANALSEYLAENPVQPGATQEQAEQIEANKKAIEELQKNGTGGGITVETDPTVPGWAKQEDRPSYTAAEVGADPAGTAAQALNAHDVDDEAHEDIRALIEGLTTRLNALANSDDTTLDQMAEVVAYIKNNKTLIDAVTTGKVSTSDIVNNLTTNVSTKVLSAAQGVALKALIDAIIIPTTLPNPQPIVINGESYDGSVKKEITIQPGSSTGGAAIDDTTASATTTYSSQKIEEELSAKKSIDYLSSTGSSESGAANRYALNYTDGTSDSFTVYNGEKGEPGDDYVLTEEDKREIAGMIPGGSSGLTAAQVNALGNMFAACAYDSASEYAEAYEAFREAFGYSYMYTVTNVHENTSNSNEATQVAEKTEYTATITPNDGYRITSATVSMGGVDITDTAYTDGVITIDSVTGDIVITATAVAAEIQDTSAVIEIADSGLNRLGDVKSVSGAGITKAYSIDDGDITHDGTNVTGGSIKGAIVYGEGDTFVGGNARLILYDANGVARYYTNNASSTAYIGTFYNTDGSEGTSGGYTKINDGSVPVSLKFTVFTAYADKSYAYFANSGRVIFAGVNSPYYGMANIDGTLAGP